MGELGAKHIKKGSNVTLLGRFGFEETSKDGGGHGGGKK